MWIAETEVWRTCTAEPIWSGIHFTYSKDVSNFRSLLKSPQSLVVDIGNYIVGPYNGSFNATLSVSFYNTTLPRLQSPDQIVPLSNIQPNGISTYFSLPNDTSLITVFIPSNTTQLVLEMFASGNGDEEFWYSNAPNEYIDTFEAWNISLLGEGSFREVLVHIDNEVVGVASPFEVVFTGGLCPGLWSKIVDYRTFDLPAYQVDLTPFLDQLRGSEHQVSFSMQGQPNTLQNWYVSGHLQLWYCRDSLPSPTNELCIAPTANITSFGEVASDNTSFSVTTLASRRDRLYSVEYENHQFYQLLDNGSTLVQPVFQKTNFDSPLSRGHYIFSMNSTTTGNPDGSFSTNVSLFQVFHRYSISIIDGSVSLEHAEVSTVGTLFVSNNANLSHTNGNTSVMFSFSSTNREYVRNVRAVGSKIVYDYEMDTFG